MTTVVTGFTSDGYDQYGKTFVESFDKFWPEDTALIVYSDIDVKLPRGRLMPVPADCRAFLHRHANNPVAHGRLYRSGMSWKQREIDDGYSFRYDAWKFCQMAFYARAALNHTLDEILVWMDADVVTFKAIPDGFVSSLICNDVVAYLGRRGAHSETGFIVFRLPYARVLIEEWADLYHTGRIFGLSEWHSARAFDIARDTTCILGHNMTPNGRGHVWFQSPLGEYMDHKKGDRRKALGRSPERKAT